MLLWPLCLIHSTLTNWEYTVGPVSQSTNPPLPPKMAPISPIWSLVVLQQPTARPLLGSMLVRSAIPTTLTNMIKKKEFNLTSVFLILKIQIAMLQTTPITTNVYIASKDISKIPMDIVKPLLLQGALSSSSKEESTFLVRIWPLGLFYKEMVLVVSSVMRVLLGCIIKRPLWPVQPLHTTLKIQYSKIPSTFSTAKTTKSFMVS